MSTSSIFRNRTFVIVWIGQTVSIVGDILFNLALMWWIVSATGSGLAMSASALATGLPRVFFGPVAGVLADRLDRRRLMIATNGINALVTLGIVFLYYQGIFSLPLIIMAAAVLGTVAAIHNPCFEATIPSIVDVVHLTRANSLSQTSRSMAGIVAPALSGVIIAAAGVGASITINSLTFVIAGISLLLVSLPSPKVAPRNGVIKQSLEGFRFIYVRRMLLAMLLFFAVVNLAMSPISIAVPILVLKVLDAGPTLMGAFGSSHSLGVLAGSSFLAALPRMARRSGLVVVLAIITGGLSLMAMGIFATPMALIVAAFSMGFAIVMAQISAQYIWQRETPDSLRGRVFAARITMSAALIPLGQALAGPAVDAAGPAVLLTVAGGACALGGCLGFLVPGLTRYTAEG